jgi:hypothetical protein
MKIPISDKGSLKAISALLHGYISGAPITAASRSWSSMLVIDIGGSPANPKKRTSSNDWSLVVEWGRWRLQSRDEMIVTSRSTEKKIDAAVATLVGQKTESLTFHANGRLSLKLANGLSLNIRPSGAPARAVISDWFLLNGKGWSLAFNPNRRFIVEATDSGHLLGQRARQRVRQSATAHRR